MNNINKNEVVLVDKALLQRRIKAIKEKMKATKENYGDSHRFLQWTHAEAQKNLLEDLGLWEEQA